MSGLPPPPLLRRIGGVGGHEEARTRATDARVVLVHVLLEDVVVLAVVRIEICGAGGLEVVLGTSDARVVLEVPSGLDVVTATVDVAVLVVAVQLIVFCTGRVLSSDRLPGAVV